MSPFEHAYDSLDRFVVSAKAGTDDGALDARDVPDVIGSVLSWHADRAWDLWQ